MASLKALTNFGTLWRVQESNTVQLSTYNMHIIDVYVIFIFSIYIYLLHLCIFCTVATPPACRQYVLGPWDFTIFAFPPVVSRRPYITPLIGVKYPQLRLFFSHLQGPHVTPFVTSSAQNAHLTAQGLCRR